MPSGWRPDSPSVDADAFAALLRESSVVAIHFWAAWNGIDRTFDQWMRPIREEFAGRVAFRSMDTDSSDGGQVAKDARVLSLPALGVWVRGHRHSTIIGCRRPEEVRAHLLEALRVARPANETLEAFVREVDAAGILRWGAAILGHLEEVEPGPLHVVHRDRLGREIRITPPPDDWDFSSVWIGSSPAERPFASDLELARAAHRYLAVEARCRQGPTRADVSPGMLWAVSGNGDGWIESSALEPWDDLDEMCRTLGVRRSSGLGAQVTHRYQESHRAYHTLRQLREAHDALLECRDRGEGWDDIRLALWFHDAIYDTHRHDNEERSADWAREELLRAGAPEAVAARVQALVLATKHREPPDGNDARLLVDADLSILAAPPDRFAAYERQIRKEYDWVPEPQFREAREKFLRGMLARPSIFNDAAMRERHEAHARRNIEASLRTLV